MLGVPLLPVGAWLSMPARAACCDFTSRLIAPCLNWACVLSSCLGVNAPTPSMSSSKLAHEGGLPEAGITDADTRPFAAITGST